MKFIKSGLQQWNVTWEVWKLILLHEVTHLIGNTMFNYKYLEESVYYAPSKYEEQPNETSMQNRQYFQSSRLAVLFSCIVF